MPLRQGGDHEVRNERNDVMDWCCLKCAQHRMADLKAAEAAPKLPPPMAV